MGWEVEQAYESNGRLTEEVVVVAIALLLAFFHIAGSVQRAFHQQTMQIQ